MLPNHLGLHRHCSPREGLTRRHRCPLAHTPAIDTITAISVRVDIKLDLHPETGTDVSRSAIDAFAGVTGEDGERVTLKLALTIVTPGALENMRQMSVEAAWQKNGQCRECSFRDLVLFADLKEADLDLIHLPISEVRLEKGGTLYHAGDDATSLFTVRSGLVKLVRYLPDGAQRIVRLLKPGSTAGLEASLGHSYEHSAFALRPTTVCRIPRAVIRRLMEKTPRLHGQLMERWHRAVQEADECLTSLSTGKASRRLARLLLQLAAPDGKAPLFSREDLGSILGITTEHACRTIADLRRAGAIEEVSGDGCRCNADRLYELAEAER